MTDLIYVLYESPYGYPIVASTDQAVVELWKERLVPLEEDMPHFLVVPVPLDNSDWACSRAADKFFCMAMFGHESAKQLDEDYNDPSCWLVNYYLTDDECPYDEPFVGVDKEFFEVGTWVATAREAIALGITQYPKFIEEIESAEEPKTFKLR